MKIYETDFRKFSGLCCKIQMRQVSGVWQQRHIWFPPTPHVTTKSVEPWIKSIQTPPGANFRPVV
jgi:hypothetical protein